MKRVFNGRNKLPEPHHPWTEERKDAARKRGRLLGQTVNPRDERGWMIPRAGTVRRKIYDLMVQGKEGKEIWQKLGLTHATYVTHRQNIVATDRLNAQRYNASHDSQVRVPPSVEYKRGWDAAMEVAAEIAVHLNGWGTPQAPELAEHIAKTIREQR